MSKRIAVLVASIDREYQQDFASGLASAGVQYDADICIFNSQGHMNVAISTNSEVGESMIYDLPDLNEFDGVITMLATMGNDIAHQKVLDVVRPFAKTGKPHVSIDVPMEGAVCILFDDAISVGELTDHLISEHGARRIAFVSGPKNSNVSSARLEACREAMRRHGLTLDDNLVFDGEWTRVGGRRAAERILESGGQIPDAVICANDDMALSVIEYMSEHGIRVPKDVMVTGFDALREAVMRGVTSVCRPVDRSARKAVEILCRWIDGEAPKEKEILLSTIPIYGVSCGCSQSLEHMNEKLRALGTERWNMETILTRVSMYSGTLAGVGDELEAAEKIRDFTDSWNIRELYLCVDPVICGRENRTAEGSSFPDEMYLLYGIRNGKEYRQTLIDRRDLVPALQEMRKNPSCLVFCPLYYRNKNFGYVAMDLGNGTGSALYSVLMLLNGALISLYLQTNIKQYAAKIEDMAVHDIMTGLLNRRGYMEQAPIAMGKARKTGKYFALLSMDMDHMKKINDEHGHMMGDEAICRMGRALRVLERQGVTPVHISGDEFLAYGIMDSQAEAEALIPAIQAELDRMNREEPWISEIGASIGLYAAVPESSDLMDEYMSKADRAMYEDKARRKKSRPV
ncbi:MAG: GGDEF domain-containing protein [Clostridia bacterium]|nr:GGDEF domain-containing protein [Clostridia bacterium]